MKKKLKKQKKESRSMRQHQSTLRSFLSPNKRRKGGKERKRATNILIVHPFNKKRIGEYGINKITTKKKFSL